ncbi:MAG TPA: type II secretion system protein [Phycisphaerae bacterium]|nr:type II secretion system protein [Phycisphaerae bacterium]
MFRPRRRRGFTLIELLVVIGIIGVLITLLVPTVSRATVMVREHVTRSTIKELEVGLEAFKADFGLYPPSQPYVSNDPAAGQRATGAANLTYYLLGPGRSGWGTAGGGIMPFGRARPSRSYGPYFRADEDAMRYYEDAGREGQVAGFLDRYNPAGVILYFAGRLLADGNTRFYWADCNDGGADQRAMTNYASEEYFQQCAMEPQGRTQAAPTRYYRQDYFLVSPGLDGRYGAILQNQSTGEWDPTDLGTAGAHCDDIGNWKRYNEP